jgi:hypothetical protein
VYSVSDYYGESEERDIRDARQADELYEDERAERLAKEMAFIEYEACTPECFNTLNHTPACEASGIAEPVASAVAGWMFAIKQAA